MEIPKQPLGLIKNVVEACGLDVTYVYEDLVFVNHNAFIIQMGEEGKDLWVWFNNESEEEKRPGMLQDLQMHGEQSSFNISHKGTYDLQSNEEGSFQLSFSGEKAA